MENRKLAKNARAVTASAGKYALKGIKFAGKGILTGAEYAGKGIKSLTEDVKGRKLVSKIAIIAACVAMPSVAATILTGGITATALKYVCDKVVLGKDISPLEAAESITHSADNILDHTLAAVSIPLHGLSKGVENVARFGKNALTDKKPEENTQEEEEQR